MVRYIDDHKERYGVEPICRTLPIAPSTYYEEKARERDPDRRPARYHQDEALKPEITRVWHEPADLVDRQFVATRPDQLWVADLTYVATWRGFVFVAFVIDVFSRRVVGWRVSRSMKTELVLNALEQAIHARGNPDDLIHHSDRGSQYLSIRYSERLAEAGITASVGSAGDSYDNALAETINGLYKTEVIRKRGPWRNVDQVEYATLEWVDWFNNRRLLQPIGDIPPAEYEAMYYRNQAQAMAA